MLAQHRKFQRLFPLGALVLCACGDSQSAASSPDRAVVDPIVSAPTKLAAEAPAGGTTNGAAATVDSALPTPPREPEPSAAQLATQLPRPVDPAYFSVAKAIETGDAARARREWLALPDSLHKTLLNARLYALEGDEIASVREVEAARARFPDQGAVFATAAEIHAAGRRFSSAEDEIREGLLVAGETPELLRARGVLALCKEGGALTGLGHLLEARKRAPDLEFSDHVLAEAYRLLGAAALAARSPAEAGAYARAALEREPGDSDARQMLGDALAAVGDFDGALEQYEQLLASGVDQRAGCALMNVKGATAALLESKRELAIQRYLRARELGSSDEELGFGASVLQEEAEAAIDAGLAAYEGAQLDAARQKFEYALRCEPQSIAAHNHLGVVAFKMRDYGAAAKEWERVLDLAKQAGVELPEPVHLNLARALHQSGRIDEVEPLLTRWLELHPNSEHAAATREMLQRL